MAGGITPKLRAPLTYGKKNEAICLTPSQTNQKLVSMETAPAGILLKSLRDGKILTSLEKVYEQEPGSPEPWAEWLSEHWEISVASIGKAKSKRPSTCRLWWQRKRRKGKFLNYTTDFH